MSCTTSGRVAGVTAADVVGFSGLWASVEAPVGAAGAVVGAVVGTPGPVSASSDRVGASVGWATVPWPGLSDSLVGAGLVYS